MEVTLRRAHQLEKLALDTMRQITVQSTIEVSIYSQATVDNLIATGRDRFIKAADETLALQNAAFTIRAAISRANHTSGVNGLLSEKAQLEARERTLRDFLTGVEVGAEEDLAAVNLRLEAMRKRAESTTLPRGFAGEESVSVSVLRDAEAEPYRDMLVTIRDRKAQITDELHERNRDAIIVIADEIVALLKRHKISV